MIVQAAAGGVGLKAVEYAQWLRASTVGTAGRPHKHAQLRATSVGALCSSRDGAALTMGMTRHMAAARSHAVLNSLSLDFITASFASLGEGGAFEEIGKRGIWASIATVHLQPRPHTARSRSTPTWCSIRRGCAAYSCCSHRVRVPTR